MIPKQLYLPGMEIPEPVAKEDTYRAVQREFVSILTHRDRATADSLRDYLDIPPEALPMIGAAIRELARQGIIEKVKFAISTRKKTHGRPLRVWRISQKKSPLNG